MRRVDKLTTFKCLGNLGTSTSLEPSGAVKVLLIPCIVTKKPDGKAKTLAA